MKLPEIIGLSGRNGAGKDTLANLRAKHEGAEIKSLSDVLRAEAAARGLDTQRKNLSEISTQYASRFGADALAVEALVGYIETRTDTEAGFSLVSVRRPAEAKTIQAIGGAVVWIDGPIEKRYRNVIEREGGRPEDLVFFDEFVEQEHSEMYPKTFNPFGLDMRGVREIADINIWNDFDTAVNFEEYLIRHYELGSAQAE